MDKFSIVDYKKSQDSKLVSFGYLLEHDQKTWHLTETLEFPIPLPDSLQIKKLLEALHIALSVSYYKAFLAPKITNPYNLNQAEAGFWNNVFVNGLGEFLHVNNLPSGSLAKFEASEKPVQHSPEPNNLDNNRCLLGVGGGKDSIVAGEALKNIGLKTEGFVLATKENIGQAGEVASMMEINLNIVKRTLDPQIIEINKLPGALNGHIPISVIFALVGSILATANGSRYVVVANESSASLPRANGINGAVNHQWSKSIDFERLLQQYFKDTRIDIEYFSAIRQLSSVAVAKLLSKLPKYFEVFTSDNGVFKIDPASRPNGRWGLSSSKSLSSYILLRPWLNDQDMQTIFGANLLDLSQLESMFLSLLGVAGDPPLDCVGTPEELRLSIELALKNGLQKEDYLMRLTQEKGIINEAATDQELKESLRLNENHAIPIVIADKLTNYFEKELSK